MSINRPPFYVQVAGSATAGPITVAGVQAGDLIAAVLTSAGAIPTANSFESVVSVSGQIQQGATGLNGTNFNFLVFPQGWKSIQ